MSNPFYVHEVINEVKGQGDFGFIFVPAESVNKTCKSMIAMILLRMNESDPLIIIIIYF